MHDKRNDKVSYGKFHSYWLTRDEREKNRSKSKIEREMKSVIKKLDYNNRILCLFDVFSSFQCCFCFSHNRRFCVHSIILFHLTVFESFQCLIFMFLFFFVFPFFFFHFWTFFESLFASLEQLIPLGNSQ